MGFPGAITAGQLAAMRMSGYYADFYMLVWDAPIIFQAQINQASFASSFAAITYDNVTVGAFTDIASDYRVYISATAGKVGILSATHTFRIRADGSYVVADATTININETSAALTDDTYIMVVKDVPMTAKVPRTITGADPSANSYNRDYAITYRRLLPIVYNLSSYYVGVLDSDGVFDLALSPLALITDEDASSISTWTWTIDGLAFQAGSAATQNITARATVTGKYLLRITATDDQGQRGYFTFKLWVVPNDRSSVINLSFDAPTISGDTVNGWLCRIAANVTDKTSGLTRIDTWPDNLDCAIWFDGNMPLITSEIVFAGRFVKESVKNVFDQTGNSLQRTSFDIEGLATQANRVLSRRMAILDDSTPTVFGEVETLTPWRAVVFFLTEHTTIPNTAAILFSSTADTFRFPRFGTGDSSAIASIIDLLFTINASPMFAPTGEIEMYRKAWMQSTSDRNGLTTVADFTTADMMTDASGGLLFTIDHDYIPIVGREVGGGAFYNTTSGDEQLLRALTPAVAQSEGNQLATLNRQILAANSTLAAAETELGQRTADDRAARQPQTILTVTMPASYIQAVIPHEGKWYTWTISATDNNRGIAYTSSDRWTCQSVSVGYNPRAGLPSLTAMFKLETQEAGFQTIVATPPIGQVRYLNPIQPVAPTYAAFPEQEAAYTPDPSNIEDGDEPIFSPDDVDKAINPTDPHQTATGAGERAGAQAHAVVIWDASTVWDVKRVQTVPAYLDITPSPLIGSLTAVKLSKVDTAAWAVENDGTDSNFWRTDPYPTLWSNAELSDGIYKLIMGTAQLDDVYVYAAGTAGTPTVWDFSVNNQGFTSANVPGFSPPAGTYSAGLYWRNGDVKQSFTFGRVCQITKTISSQTITSLEVELNYTKGFFETTPTMVFRVWFNSDFPAILNVVNSEATDGSPIFLRWEGSEASVTKIEIYTRSSATTSAATSPRYSGSIQILSVTINGGFARTRYSTDSGDTFDSDIFVGASPLTGDDAGAAAILGVTNDTIVAAQDTKIKEASAGGEYTDEADGATAGTFAMAIAPLSYGAGDYFYATAAAVAGDTLFRVVLGSKTSISPDDGGGNGIVVGPFGLAVDPRFPARLFGLFTFSGTVKLAYSHDSGITWQFNSQVSANAIAVAVKNRNAWTEVYIADGSSLWFGSWDGAETSTLTMLENTSPATTLLGVDVL